jgi:hypothetical protein
MSKPNKKPAEIRRWQAALAWKKSRNRVISNVI